VAAAASSFPAWRATRLSPMAAIRDESQSVWESARSGIGRTLKGLSQAMTSAEPAALSETALLADFVASSRRASSPADQLQIAVTTLRDRLGAQSVRLFEKSVSGDYRCTVGVPVDAASDVALPADGFLVGRLAINSTPLALSSGYLDTL